MLFCNAKNLFAHCGREFDGSVSEQLVVQNRRRARDAGEGNVDTVRRGSGHETENKHGLLAHEICFFSSARRLRASSGFNWSRSAPRNFSSTSRSSAVKSARWLPFVCAGSEAPGES